MRLFLQAAFLVLLGYGVGTMLVIGRLRPLVVVPACILVLILLDRLYRLAFRPPKTDEDQPEWIPVGKGPPGRRG